MTAPPGRVNWPLLIAIGVGLMLALSVASAVIHHRSSLESMDESGVYYHLDEGGTFETAGSARTNGRSCQWMRLSADWDQKDGITDLAASLIDRGDVRQGQVERVTLKGGEWFVSFGCQPWTHR